MQTTIRIPPWGVMWLAAAVLFATFKALTWRGRSALANAGGVRALGYLAAWVGMDAEAFYSRSLRRVETWEWALATLKSLLGAVVLWSVVPRLPADRSVLIGAVGFAGLILLLHFGLFHLLALAWRRVGSGVQPIMQLPLLSTSLAEFWGRRWNRAYRDVSFECCFRPAVRRFGTVAGTLLAFGASGLMHELVISLPAGAGFGGPTVYFVIQGAGLLLERTPAIRSLARQRPFLGWCWTAAFLVGPLVCLFHPAFLTCVIVPFLSVIGAR